MNVKVGRGEDGGRGLDSAIYASTLRTNSLRYERKAMKCQLTRGYIDMINRDYTTVHKVRLSPLISFCGDDRKLDMLRLNLQEDERWNSSSRPSLFLHSCPSIRLAVPSSARSPLLVWQQPSPHIAHPLAFSSLAQTVDLPQPVVPTNHRSSWHWKRRCWVEGVAPVQALALQLV
jgi:hypothetical protein